MVRLQSILTDTLELLYPRCCVVCENRLLSQEEFICFDCWSDLPVIPVEDSRIPKLEQLFWGKVVIERVVALFGYKSGSKHQNIIRAIKYRGRQKLGVEMGIRLGKYIQENRLLNNIDVILPVPLHKKKLKKRGFNQSAKIASGLSQVLDIELSTENLTRIKHTPTQTKKSKYERWKNVKDAFAIKNSEKLKHKHILLVDDVLTTGSTIEACAHEILTIEETTVSVATLGAADY